MSRAKAKPPARGDRADAYTAHQVMVRASQEAARDVRCDVWLEFGDGWYRFFLPMARIAELEEKLAYLDKDGNRRPGSLSLLHGQVMKGRYVVEGRPFGFAVEAQASPRDCREVIRCALVGGGMGIVDGRRVTVDSVTARRLVDAHLSDVPAVLTWDIAAVILDAAVVGRPVTEAERASADPRRDIVPPVPVDE